MDEMGHPGLRILREISMEDPGMVKNHNVCWGIESEAPLGFRTVLNGSRSHPHYELGLLNPSAPKTLCDAASVRVSRTMSTFMVCDRI